MRSEAVLYECVHLTSGASVRHENNVMYTRGAEFSGRIEKFPM